MAGKSSTPTIRQAAKLAPDDVRRAIPRLLKRITDIRNLDLSALNDLTADEVLHNQETRINTTLADIFGAESFEYHQFKAEGLTSYTPAMAIGADFSYRGRLPSIKNALEAMVATLQSACDMLEEKVEHLDPTASVLRAYEGLNLHPEIARRASKLFVDGHYANAVEAAVKTLNGLVRYRSDLDIDGASLMERAFSPGNPILKFNDLSSQPEKDEQKGFMMMFSGAVAGLRNPRAHEFIKDDPERAIEFIAFVSLLAKLLDESET